VVIHLSLLHIEGSSNPLGVCTNTDTVSFYPYFYLKDLFGFTVFLLFFSYFVFFNPNLLAHPDNYIKANALVTPTHIVPE
jgi:ubiquinol-cytochrome c reductase cytochrome b subunit